MKIELIHADPNQPRKYFDEEGIRELSQSMEANGLAVPILVRPDDEGYLIVHGERRYRAAQLLGWEEIPAEVRELSIEEAGWLSLIENIQREDLSPIEEAQAYRIHLENMTQAELGERIGKDRSYISQKLRLLTLPPPIQYYLNTRSIREGHAGEHSKPGAGL